MLYLRFFGAPVVRLDDQSLPALTRSPLLTRLLAFLVTYRDRPHSRSVLAALFWPELPEPRARQYLNTHLSRLRRELPRPPAPPYLLSDRETVQFNAAAPFWLDVAEFEAAMVVLRRTSERMADLTPEVLGGLERAVELYRGDFLEGCYTEWCGAVRERLREKFLLALEALAQANQDLGRPEAALDLLQRLVQADPLREDAHFQLMRLLLRLGRLSEAQGQFHRYEQLWRDELQAEPSPRMQMLWAEINPPLATIAALAREASFARERQQLDRLRAALPGWSAPGKQPDDPHTVQQYEQIVELAGRLGQALKAHYANTQAREYLELAIGALEALPETRERLERNLLLRRACDELYDLRADRRSQAGNLNRMGELVRQLGDPAARIDLLARQAWLAMQEEKYASAITLAAQMLHLCRGNGQQESLAHRLLGISYDRTGDFRTALQHYADALALDEARNDVWCIYLGLNNVGSVMNNRGDYIAALEYLQRAEALTPVEAPLYRRATVAGNLGNVLTKLGRLSEATDYLREAMSLVWRSGDRERECWLGGRLALLYWRRGEHDRALMMAHHSYAAAHALGGAWEQAQLAELLAMFYCESNNGPPALAWARRADEVATAYGLWRYRLRSRMRLAQAHLLLDQPVQAKESAAQAVALFQENEQPLEEEPELFWTWSQSAAVNGERAMAVTAHGRAQGALQRIAQRIPQPDWREGYLTAEPLCWIWPAFNGRRCFSPLSAL